MQFVIESFRLNKYREQHAKALTKVQTMEAEGVDKDSVRFLMDLGHVHYWGAQVQNRRTLFLRPAQ